MANTLNYNLYKPNRADNTVEVDTSLANNFTIIDTEIKNRKNEIDGLTTRTATVEGRVDNLVISAGDSNTEIVDARGGFPTLSNRLESADDTLTDLGLDLDIFRSQAQMKKITADDGNVKLAVDLTTDDFFAKLLALGVGAHTFYCIGGAINAPARTVRGLAHITGINPNNGYVLALDYTGAVYSNYVFNGVWTGWETHLTNKALTWSNITITNGSNGSVTPQYAIVGKKVIFRGTFTITTYGTQSFTLPTNARPSVSMNPLATNTASGRNGAVRAFVATTGVTTFFGTINSGDTIDLTSMYYYID